MDNPSVVFVEAGRVEIVNQPMPAPAAGEVLIRTTCSLISTGTELMLLSGKARHNSVWAEITEFPFRPGYSNVGEVVETGAGVEPWWLGRRVGTHTAHAAYVTCAVNALRPLPDTVRDEDATFGTLSEVVMNGLRRGRLTWGESVAVVGLGLLGQLCVRLCALAGAHTVYGIELSPRRLRWMPEGASFCGLLGKAGELKETIMVRNKGRLLDIVFELTSDSDAIPGQLTLLRPQGRFVILSSPRGATLFDFHDLCNRQSFTIIGAHGFSHPPVETLDNPWTGRRHGELFLDLLAAGKLNVSELISHRIPSERAPEAYELLAARREEAMGILLEWDR
jgi:2-desacetyl-2-hydroxyethyl bacteriochlorophyllide A dehydrogenase